MKHSHIAIFSAPGPTHVYPTLTIVTTLVRRGYRVSYVTSESFAAPVRKLGAEVLRCPRLEFPFDQNKNEALGVEDQYSPDIIDLAARTVALVLPFYQRNKPDLVLYDIAAYAGLIVGEKLRVPTIRISPQFAYNETNIEHSVLPHALRDKALDMVRLSDQFFHMHGVKRNNVVFDMAAPTIYLYVDDFQLGQHARDSNNFYAGRCAAERPCEGIWSSARVDNRPSVLITASTVYRQPPAYYKMCLEAIGKLHWHTILAIGANDPSAFEPLPPHCEIVRHTPLVLVMPHADVIVCAAGMSTTMESMYHGLPMLMLTYGEPELEAYAQNVENLGLGRHLRKDAAGDESVARSIAEMAEDAGVRSRVRQMQHKVRRSAGGEEVVNWMEEYLN